MIHSSQPGSMWIQPQLVPRLPLPRSIKSTMRNIGGQSTTHPDLGQVLKQTQIEPQIERESNGIRTGMHMNRMYALGTHVDVVTEHKPLIPVYNDPRKPTQLHVDRHCTKLLPFCYYEPGNQTPCDYGS